LRDAHALLRQASTEIFLIGYPFGGDEPQDLAMAECFSSAHSVSLYIRLYIYTITQSAESKHF
jgi:hypothetical protein